VPGFNIGGLGGGFTSGPSNTIETRRKHRWIFEYIGKGAGSFTEAELLILQSASRPNIKFEEPEMHHNQEVARFAGKQDWEPVNLVWYDAEQNPDVSRSIYQWIETIVNMSTIVVAAPVNYKRTASLALLNGAGQPSERWMMYGTWPAQSNWQELNYTSSEILTIEVTMRYDRAIRTCQAAPVPAANVPTC
jgi:hypothetical protein